MGKVQQKEKANPADNELCMVGIWSKGEGTREKMISMSNVFINHNSKQGLGGKLQLEVM